METEDSENEENNICIVKNEPEDYNSGDEENYNYFNEENYINDEEYDEQLDIKQEELNIDEEMFYTVEIENNQSEEVEEPINNCNIDEDVALTKREEQLYPCKYCTYVGKHPKHLKTHINNRHIKTKIYQCPHCTFNSTILRNTKEHVENKHDNEDEKPIECKRKCRFCDYTIANATIMKRHMNKHTKEKIHQCPYCKFNTIWEGYLRMHIRRKHCDKSNYKPIKKHKCPYCKYEALSPSSLKLHIKVHTRENELQCPYCPLKTIWSTYLKSHIDSKHLKIKAIDNKRYECKVCEYKAKNITLLKQHMNKHTKEKIHKCPHCKFSTLWVAYMKLHIKRKHSVKIEDDKSNFQCHYCNYNAISSSHLKLHENKHTKAKEYKCDQCDFKTSWYYYLKLHSKRKHSSTNIDTINKNEHQCKFCSYKSTSLCSLKIHQNKHTKEIIYNCPHCDFKTIWSTYIKMHIKKHKIASFKTRKRALNDRKYPCNYCDYKATQIGSLKLHINSIHTKKNIHKCTQCDYRCTIRGNLKLHIKRRHGCVDIVKDETISCEYCSYKTTNKQVMKRHLNKHTRQNVLNCPHCPYTTVWGYYMKIHIKNHNEPNRLKRNHKKKSFQCENCEYECFNLTDLKKHISSIHTGKTMFNCQYCEHKSLLQGNLKQHIKRKHPEEYLTFQERYKCLNCNFKTSYERNLMIHTKKEHEIHEDENGEFSCKLCEYKSKNLYSLKVHQNKHRTECLYKCPECEFSTKWPDYLKKHIEKHSLNKRKVFCVYCDYKGVSTFRLKKHCQSMHMKDQYYVCPKNNCQFKSTYYTSLRIHLKGIHDTSKVSKTRKSSTRNFSYNYSSNEGRYFACDYCEYASKTQGNLYVHVKNKHEKKNVSKCTLCTYKTTSKIYLNHHMNSKHSIRKNVKHEDKKLIIVQEIPVVNVKEEEKSDRVLRKRKLINLTDETFYDFDLDLDDSSQQCETKKTVKKKRKKKFKFTLKKGKRRVVTKKIKEETSPLEDVKSITMINETERSVIETNGDIIKDEILN